MVGYKKISIFAFFILLLNAYSIYSMQTMRRTWHTKSSNLFAPKNIRIVNSSHLRNNSHELNANSCLNSFNLKSSHFSRKWYKPKSKLLNNNFSKIFYANLSNCIVIPATQIATSISIAKFSWSSLIVGLATWCGLEINNENKNLDKIYRNNQIFYQMQKPKIIIEVSEVPSTKVITSEEKLEKAQQIKKQIDTFLLACLDNDSWDKNITFAETVDLCLNAIKGYEDLIDEYRYIFFMNEPESWPKISGKKVICLLLEVRDKNSSNEIGIILQNLFYLLPEKIQQSYQNLIINLPWRLWKGHPGTKSTYVFFEKKEQEIR